MPSKQAQRTRHHSNLRPKHKHTKDYLKPYWPYVPVILLMGFAVWLAQPLYARRSHQSVLAYATSMNSQQLLNSTNTSRQADKLETLKLNEQLAKAAQDKANDMVAKDYWAHATPDGTQPWAFVTTAGYQYQKAGENLAYGFLTSDETIQGWLGSPSHRANMLDPDFNEVGFGFANSRNFDKNGPATVVVAMYGRSMLVPMMSRESMQTGTGFNTVNTTNRLGTTQSLNRAELWFGRAFPWISMAIAVCVGSLLTLLAVKYGRFIRKKIAQGEAFIAHHPLLDLSLVLVIAVGILLTRQLGTVL